MLMIVRSIERAFALTSEVNKIRNTKGKPYLRINTKSKQESQLLETIEENETYIPAGHR